LNFAEIEADELFRQYYRACINPHLIDVASVTVGLWRICHMPRDAVFI